MNDCQEVDVAGTTSRLVRATSASVSPAVDTDWSLSSTAGLVSTVSHTLSRPPPARLVCYSW